MHFNNLKSDMAGEIGRIAAFLEIDIAEENWTAILNHCSFDYMKQNADSLSEHFKDLFDGGLRNFIYKGTNGRWRDALSAEEIQKYENASRDNLTVECAEWLATGQMPE